MKSTIRKKIEATLQKMALAAKTADDVQAIAWASQRLQDPDADRWYQRVVRASDFPAESNTKHRQRHIYTYDDKRKLIKTPISGDFVGTPKTAETKAIHAAFATANHPRHVPILDIRSSRTLDHSPKVKVTRRGQTIGRSTQEIDATIRSLDARIETRKARWAREDETAKLSREYCVSYDKAGNQTCIAWDVLRASRPDLYAPAFIPLASAPRKHASEIPSAYYPARGTGLRVRASRSIHAPRPVAQWTPRPVMPPVTLRHDDRPGNLMWNQRYSDIPANPAKQIAALPGNVKEYAFHRNGDDTVHVYRGLHEPSDEMKAFNPRHMEASPTKDTADVDPITLDTTVTSVPRIQNYKTRYERPAVRV